MRYRILGGLNDNICNIYIYMETGTLQTVFRSLFPILKLNWKKKKLASDVTKSQGSVWSTTVDYYTQYYTAKTIWKDFLRPGFFFFISRL